MIVRPTTRPAGEIFTFAGGLFRAHVADGVPLDRLAAQYGMSLPRLRGRLADYVAACTAVLERPEEVGAVAPPPPPPHAQPSVRMRVRERIEVPAIQAVAEVRPADLRPVITELVASGTVSHSAVARALNMRGIRAPRGGEWSAAQVSRLRDRLASGGLSCP